MEGNLTNHAEKRKGQRGFSGFSMNIIKEFGRWERVPGNAVKIFFGKKEYQQAVGEFKKAIQLLDKTKGGTMIMANGDILTIYR